MDLQTALKLLSLPRAGIGRFGPYIAHDGTYASLDSAEEVFTVGINRAVTLLAERKARGPRARRGGQALKELGAHPQSGVAIRVMKGRYGPYVSDGKLNATIPRDQAPESVTMEEAVALLAAHAEKTGKKPARPAKKKAAVAEKTEPKKPAAKSRKRAKKTEPTGADTE